MAFTLDVPTGYSIARLDPTIHARSGFSCGVAQLDGFLHAQASQDQNKNLSKSFVLVRDGSSAVVGYVSLVNKEIPLADAPEALRKTRYPALPAILLARMAVDVRHQGRGLGGFLVKYALHTSWEVSQLSGCCAVLVDAKNEKLKDFYRKYGFQEFREAPLRLYVPMSSLQRIFKPPQ